MLTSNASLYPPSPAAVPPGFTRPNSRYVWLVTAMSISILLFIGLYLLLLAGAMGLVYFTLTHHFESYSLWTGLFHLGSVVASLMLVAFLVKAVFKRRPAGSLGDNPRLTPEAHPALFNFVNQLCIEAGAPRPKYICVGHDVNAAVFYDNSLRSLFWPTRKNLFIGLGLVNGLSLSEFKAVLAHEFGHFAQRSMRLGSYVNTASRLLHDMVYERDQWDEMLVRWRSLDLRLSAAAWVMTALVWAVRKLLELAFQGINLVHASLSREMEFQADRVAVRMAGSQAMCDVLYQLGPVSEALQAATQQLGVALEHKLATDDIFYHQSHYLRDALAARPTPAPPASGEPLRRFAPDEVNVVAMYASHPADYLREAHAQQPFVPGPADDRSPWLLFGDADGLRQAVTRRMYPDFAPGTAPEVLPAAQVEAFLAAERSEMEYADLYAGTYDSRLVTLLDPTRLNQLADDTTLPPGPLPEARAALFGPELRERTEAHTARQADLQKLALFRQKLTKDRTFTVAGTSYPATEAAAVAARLEQENEYHNAWLTDFDRQVLAVHWRMLAHRPERRADWLARFTLQHAIQLALRDVREARSSAAHTMHAIEQQGTISEQEATSYTVRFEQNRLGVQQAFTAARQVALLPLTHISGFATLADFVLQGWSVPHQAYLTGDWINSFFQLLDTADDRLRRLYFKNLGVLLRLEEELAASYAEAVPA